jgi:excisionase family DNA binding protein
MHDEPLTALLPLLKPSEVAGFLSVSRPTCHRLMTSGELPSVRVGHHRRVSIPDLMAYCDRQTPDRKGV